MSSLNQRASKRAAAAERRRIAKLEAETRAEQKAEDLAPAVQRNDVTGADGSVIRAARVVRSGAGFIRANPLATLAANGMFRAPHVAAAKRLITAWDAVGEGVGLGASNWGSLGGGGGSPGIPSGYSALLAQISQRRELDGAATWCGALWPCLEGVVLRGMSLSAWATRAGWDRSAVPGYLLAALDRLVEFYGAIDGPGAVGQVKRILDQVAIV